MTRIEPPPLTLMGPAPVPSIEIEWAVLLRMSVDASAIVVALGNADGENVTLAFVASVLAFATAHGRLPLVAALLLVFVTSQLLGVTRSSSRSIRSRVVARTDRLGCENHD
jgi:hypothetical protein